jgi:hypothetical protein
VVLYVVIAGVVWNLFLTGHAPYYFLDPNSVGTVIVVVNMCAPGGCVLVLGYTLFAVNRAVATARIDSS